MALLPPGGPKQTCTKLFTVSNGFITPLVLATFPPLPHSPFSLSRFLGSPLREVPCTQPLSQDLLLGELK